MSSQRVKDRAEVVRAIRILSRYVDTVYADDGMPRRRVNTDAFDDALPHLDGHDLGQATWLVIELGYWRLKDRELARQQQRRLP